MAQEAATNSCPDYEPEQPFRAETRSKVVEPQLRQSGWQSRHQQLMELSARVVAEKTLPGLLQVIIDAARDLTGARLGVSGHGYAGGHFQIGAVSGDSSRSICPPGEIFNVERGGVYQVLTPNSPTLRLTQAELNAHPDWWGLPEGHAPLNGLLGAYLTGSEGQSNGLIMVSDKEQGEFTEEDEALLAQLANIASLSLQHIEARLEADRQRQLIEAVLQSDPAGIAVVVGPNLVFQVANPAYRSYLPDPKIDPVGRLYGEIWKVEEGFRTEGLIHRVLETGVPVSSERHMRRYPNGFVRFFSYHLTRLPSDPPSVMIALWDITNREEAQRTAEKATASAQQAAQAAEQARLLAELRAEEAEEGRRILQALMTYIPEGITIAESPDVNIRMVSQFGQDLTGQPVEHLSQIPAETHSERWQIYYLDGQALVPGEELPLSRAVLHGEVVQNEALLLKSAAGRMIPILCNAGPIRNEAGEITGGVIAWRDITQIVEMEKLLKRHASLAEAQAELSKQLAGTGADEQTVLELVTSRAAEFFGDVCSLQLVSEDGSQFSVAAIHHPDQKTRELVSRIANAMVTSLDEGVMHQLIQEGQPIFQPVIDKESVPRQMRLLVNGEYPVHSLIAVPIHAYSKVIGFITLARTRPAGPYTEEDLAFLQELADRTGLAVQNARLLRELQIELSLRERAEMQLAAYSRELELKNLELQEFSFVASHDLQEPLRKIITFGKRLEEGYSDRLGYEGRDFIARMQNAGLRMQGMLNDLLTYSRISTHPKPMVQVELTKTVQEVLSDLEVLVEDTGGTVEFDPLPVIMADEIQMRQLFQNLISNALKFHRKGVAPRARISAGEMSTASSDGVPGASSRFIEIVISDNGIGFNMQSLDRIFLPFQRLHGRSEYPGSGMGLAICKKIVERHGGMLTARSKPGQGSQFIVRLPVALD